MEYKEIKNKSIKELNQDLADQREELRELRFRANEKQLKNVKSINQVRRTIARILTALNVTRRSKVN